ncbi:hypothetical protein DP202_06055 [Enterobacter cloacae]|uniref:Uncharacterized protein n=2 Tax=Enterobacter cloacae complex TaxID=354276 RepID=A0A330GDR0_ENTCL|nr:hypothetical protein DP202_06055 [Enterobacter cloacae]
MFVNFILILFAQITFIMNMEFIYFFTRFSQYCFSYGILFNSFVFVFAFLFIHSATINKNIGYLLPWGVLVGIVIGMLSHYISGVYFKQYQVDYAELYHSRDYVTFLLSSWGWIILPLLIIPIKRLKKGFCNRKD